MKAALLLFATALGVMAQLAPPNDTGVTMGHVHLFVKDVAGQKKFWVEGLQGTAAKLGKDEVVKIPGALIVIHEATPQGGTEGTVINHAGVLVKNLKEAVTRCEAAGAKVATINPKQAMMVAPDAIRVELTEKADLETPVANHHIHFYDSDAKATQAWYAKMFDAKPGKRAAFDAADLPGVNLTFSQADSPTVPSKGRALDHIGFEVRNLEAFCRKLEQQGVKFDVPYRKVPQLGLAIAFFTDPWGTYVELTEGLGKL